jgi:hypothetical protein
MTNDEKNLRANRLQQSICPKDFFVIRHSSFVIRHSSFVISESPISQRQQNVDPAPQDVIPGREADTEMRVEPAECAPRYD